MNIKTSQLQRYSKTINFGSKVFKNIVFTNPNISGKWLKKELIDMGSVYIKVGQVISTRTDIFPDYITDELVDLQTNVPPFKKELINEIFKNDFGYPINHYFNEFSEEPIASASIGQVHVAKLKNDKIVAVKVQRPGVREEFIEELQTIISILKSFSMFEMKNVNDTLIMLEEIEKNIDKETDFIYEKNNMKIFRELLSNEARIIVPKRQ